MKTTPSVTLTREQRKPGLRTFFLAALFYALLSGHAEAQTINTVQYLGAGRGLGTLCDDTHLCCQQFKITVNDPNTTQVTIDLGGANPLTDFSCISTTCWNAQTGGGFTMSKVSNGQYKVALPAGFTPPLVLTVDLCASDTCWTDIPWLGWSDDQGIGHHWWNTQGCSESYHANCGSCDFASAYDVSNCATDICFFHNQPGSLTSFQLIFSPALRSCNQGSSTKPGCSWATGIKVDQTGWTATLNGTGDVMTITSNNPSIFHLTQCQGFCIQIPKCATAQATTVKVADGYECADSTPIHVSLKPSNGSRMDPARSPEAQNFPNPVEAATGFRTTLPFQTSTSGTASVKVMDVSGNEVLSDKQDVTYAGTHFFYFTAESLPAGTYYYQIEFPQGVVIQKKTMIVIK